MNTPAVTGGDSPLALLIEAAERTLRVMDEGRAAGTLTPEWRIRSHRGETVLPAERIDHVPAGEIERVAELTAAVELYAVSLGVSIADATRIARAVRYGIQTHRYWLPHEGKGNWVFIHPRRKRELDKMDDIDFTSNRIELLTATHELKLLRASIERATVPPANDGTGEASAIKPDRSPASDSAFSGSATSSEPPVADTLITDPHISPNSHNGGGKYGSDHPAEPVPSQRRMTLEEANQRAADLHARHGNAFLIRPLRQWAAQIGCSVGLVNKLTLWKRQRKNRPKPGTQSRPTVRLPADDLLPTPAADEPTETLETLIAEQDADARTDRGQPIHRRR